MADSKDWIVRYYASHDDIPEGKYDGHIVRELVRCKDCLYWGEDGYHNGCKYANCIMEENDYCSMAERRTK